MENTNKGLEIIGPWTRLTSRKIYENPWIHLREDQVKRPDGSPGIYGVIEYKNLAVGVVAIDEQNRVILVGQHRYPMNYYSWELPEGGCPKGVETVAAAAERELREETGYSATRWDYFGPMEISNSTTDEVAHFYLARGLKAGDASPEETEILATKLVPFDEAYRQCMNGEINESLTIVGLSRAHYFLGQEKLNGQTEPRKRK